MSSLVLSSPSQLSVSDALRISRQAPTLLNPSFGLFSLFPFSLLPGAESLDKWATYEHLLLACLRTRNDQSARLCLEKLTDRFGSSNERVQGLWGMYEEAVAEDDAALEKILQRYESTLAEDPTNTVCPLIRI